MAKERGSLGTHDGRFHADEVTAAALLLYFGEIEAGKIVRTRESGRLEQCHYICDVGGIYDPSRLLFDHHQAGYSGTLSSAGMVLLFLKAKAILSPSLYQHLNLELVQAVDAHDNGKELLGPGVTSFSHIISNFNPVAYDATPDEENRSFRAALSFAEGHISRLIERFNYVQSSKEAVKQVMAEGKSLLLFDQSIPWMDPFFELGGERHPALFVVMPAGKHWKLRGIPPSSQDRMRVRRPLPLEWAGLLQEELQEKSGIQGAIFCHKGRFISVWETKEDALKALEKALSQSSSR